jgi:hypothetical protein
MKPFVGSALPTTRSVLDIFIYGFSGAPSSSDDIASDDVVIID